MVWLSRLSGVEIYPETHVTKQRIGGENSLRHIFMVLMALLMVSVQASQHEIKISIGSKQVILLEDGKIVRTFFATGDFSGLQLGQSKIVWKTGTKKIRHSPNDAIGWWVVINGGKIGYFEEKPSKPSIFQPKSQEPSVDQLKCLVRLTPDDGKFFYGWIKQNDPVRVTK